MSKIAIISDIHANLPALNAVLEDIDRKTPDAIFCLGDLVDFAPWPNEVIETIRRRGVPTLMGNHDERIAFGHKIIPLAKHGPDERAARVTAIEHTRRTISAENRRYLSQLPREMWISHGTGKESKRVLLVHGSTRSNDEYIYENHPESDLAKMLTRSGADAIVMGHTHLPFIRKMPGPQFVVNAGSVGRSKEKNISATYLMLTIVNSRIRPQIVRVRYPVEETIKGVIESAIPDFYAKFLSERITKRV
jgi:putative phosphoesterase